MLSFSEFVSGNGICYAVDLFYNAFQRIVQQFMLSAGTDPDRGVFLQHDLGGEEQVCISVYCYDTALRCLESGMLYRENNGVCEKTAEQILNCHVVDSADERTFRNQKAESECKV